MTSKRASAMMVTEATCFRVLFMISPPFVIFMLV
jgi:hypothetical protein